MALEASGVGNTMVKSPALDDLSEPKSSTTIVLVVPDPDPAVVLYTRHPRAVMVDDPNVKSAKSVKALVPDVVGVTLVKVPPPAL